MTVNAIVGKINKVNKNNRLYTYNAIKNAIKDFQESKEDIYLYPSFDDRDSSMLSTDIMGVLQKLYLDGDELRAEINILPSKESLFSLLYNTNNVIVANFSGSLDLKNNNLVVDSCQINDLAFTAEPSWDCCNIAIDESPSSEFQDIIKFYF